MKKNGNDYDDIDSDSNCYKDPVEIEDQNKNFSFKKIDLTQTAESLKRAQK